MIYTPGAVGNVSNLSTFMGNHYTREDFSCQVIRVLCALRSSKYFLMNFDFWYGEEMLALPGFDEENWLQSEGRLLSQGNFLVGKKSLSSNVHGR